MEHLFDMAGNLEEKKKGKKADNQRLKSPFSRNISERLLLWVVVWTGPE